jgi:hypothetical protein
MNERRAIVLLLCVQAALLFPGLDLLPVWTDELFTLQTAAKTVPEIVEAVRRDIHPPLYYLMAHAWPWHDAPGLRALSAVWALAATAVFAVFWRGRAPVLAFALFALSPCLLLYGRMARSYSMQTTLALLAVALLERWVREPRAVRWAAAGGAALAALLYTHYVPGAAIAAGFAVYAWRPLGARRVALFGAAVAAAYAPWAILSADAVGRWAGQTSYAATYTITGNAGLEHLVKLGFAVVSLAIGESFFWVSLLLAPVVVFLAVRGVRAGLFPAAWIGTAAVIGYFVVSRWVSYAFVPARLLWLLPFVCLAVAAGVGRRRWLGAVILVSYVSSAALYFRRENFLNLGYVAPLREIVETLNREAMAEDVILLDPYNTDFQPIVAGLSGRTRHVVLEGRPAIPAARAVWIVRNTRDASPGGSTSAIEAAACAGRARRDTLLAPYARWQQVALRALGRPLTHSYRVTVCGPR